MSADAPLAKPCMHLIGSEMNIAELNTAYGINWCGVRDHGGV